MADSGLKSAQSKRFKGINNDSQEVTIHKLGTRVTLLFKLQQSSHFYFEYLPAKHGVESMKSCTPKLFT